MFAPHVIGESTRGLGWDMASPYSRTLGAVLSDGLRGPHGIHRHVHLDRSGHADVHDPPHEPRAPNGKGDGSELRLRVSAAVGAALRSACTSRRCVTAGGRDRGAGDDDGRRAPQPPERVPLPASTLLADDFALLAGRSVGLVTNQTGIDAEGRRSDRPARRGAAVCSSSAHLLARARHHRARSTPTCRTAATPPPGCRSGASTAGRGGRRPNAQRRRHARLRHPGRRRPLLHVPDHAGLRRSRRAARRGIQVSCWTARTRSRAASSKGH